MGMRAAALGSLMVLVAACGAPVEETGVPAAADGDPVGGTTTTTTLVSPVDLDEVVADPMLPEGGEQPLIIPGAGGSLSGDVLLACGPGGSSFPASSLNSVPPVESIDNPELLVAMQHFLSDGEGQSWPQDGWRLLDEDDEQVLIVHPRYGEDGLWFIDFKYQDSGLRWAGASASGGPCILQIALPSGLGVVTWRLDPAAEPLSPETTSIAVLATEMVCASGQPMGDRLIGPEVVMTGTEVLIAFASGPPHGGECPSNPETRVVVELPEPLGDRTLRDGLDTGLNLSDFLD